jgi:hypothetical protein
MLLQNGRAVPASQRLQNQAWAKRHVVRFGGSELLRRRCCTTGGETRPQPSEVLPAERGKPVALLSVDSKGSRKTTCQGSG